MLLGVPGSFLKVVLPVLLPQALLAGGCRTLLVGLFVLEQLVQLAAVHLTQARVAGAAVLTLAVEPAAQPDAVLGLIIQRDLQISVLCPILLGQLEALPPRVVFVPDHPDLVQLSLAFRRNAALELSGFCQA